MLAHVPSFGRNLRGSTDFLAYPVPKACLHVLGTRVPRRLGVARSASSAKAAQALGCSLTSGLRISFGRVSCMARADSVPGLWTLGFLLLCGVCVWVRAHMQTLMPWMGEDNLTIVGIVESTYYGPTPKMFAHIFVPR